MRPFQHVIQRERGRRRIFAVILALCAGIPRLVPLGETTTYPSAPSQGIPAAEDDGGEGGSPASTAGRVPLTVGFHGLRPLNDGEFGLPRPHYRCALRRSSTVARHSEGAGGDRRIPRLVPPGKRQHTPPLLRGGSPLREDNGGEGDPPASAVGRVPLTVGFHGLRHLNDGEGGFP